MNRSLVIGLLVAAACDSPKSAPKAESAPSEPAAAPAPAEKKPEPLPPAPEGTVIIGRLYVHTCADATSCPTLMQAEGAAHCAALTLGGLTWRLPTIEELQAWRGNPALSGYDVFHWTGSPWTEDPSQLWIYDPGSDSKTTALPTRKPFTIRCVAAPK